ncbi:MAG TPA: HEAT repeat domain-containing protein [Ktedonobacteraceae bacterium]
MSIQPETIDYAFHTLYYGGQADQERATFAQHWGGLSDEAFSRAIISGTREEKALAIFALGKEKTARSDALLGVHLKSQEPMERWPAALILGERHDPRALPVLIALLDDALPPRVRPLERDGGLYHFWRLKTVALFSEWGQDDLIPVLRQALLSALKLEQAEQPEIQHVWYPYQDALVYALGHLQAFGALTNLVLPTSHLHRWTVTLICGSLQARQSYGDLFTQVQINPTLREEIARVLERRFGLAAAEQAVYIDGYADAYFGSSGNP